MIQPRTAKQRYGYPPRRAWWYSARNYPARWPVIWRGGDEWDRRTVVVRVPFGALVVAVGRAKGCAHPDAYPDWGACAHCGKTHHQCPECSGPLDACPGYLDDYELAIEQIGREPEESA